jgi:hypothetical protein
LTNRDSGSHGQSFAGAAIIIISITLLVMGRLCFCQFTDWDDNFTVSQNPLLNPATLASLRFYWSHFEYRLYAPLTYTVWAGISSVARVSPDRHGITLDPLMFHAANLLLHLLAALVVCRILLLIRMSRFGATCGALLFAIHPVQVEAVAWVAGLKDVLSGLLALVALWQYLQFAFADRDGRRQWKPLAISIAALILAMLSKSSAATVGLAAIAMDRCFVGRSWKRVIASASLLLLAAIPFPFVASLAQSTAADLAPIPLWPRPMIVADSLAFYLHKLVWPMNLCIDYGRSPWSVIQQLRHAWIYSELCIPTAIIVSLIIWRDRARPLIAAALVFVAGCFSTLGWATFSMQFLSTTADHYLYWAMLGPSIALAWALTTWPDSVYWRSGIAVILLIIAILSIRQGGYWTDERSLMQHTVDVNPRSFLAYDHLGVADEEESNFVDAAAMSRQSIAINPNYFYAHSHLGSALRKLGALDESTREIKLSIALQRLQNPKFPLYWVWDLNQLGQNDLDRGEPERAAAAFRESLQTQPDQPQTVARLHEAELRQRTSATTRSSSSAPQ